MKAARKYGIAAPPDYAHLFEDLPQVTDAYPQAKMLLELADTASQSVNPTILDYVELVATRAGIDSGDEVRASSICEEFRRYIVPARSPVALADIVNAGWKAFHDAEFWKAHPEIRYRDKVLKDLFLKSIEVLEVTCRLKGLA